MSRRGSRQSERVLTDAFPALADLVLPRRCAGCGVPGTAWCRPCTPGGPAFRVDSAVGFGPVGAAAEYGGAVRTALGAYKERGRRDLVAPLALLLQRAVLLALAGCGRPVLLVGVPSSRRAAAERGGDHVQRLLRRLAPSVGCRVTPDVLSLGRDVQDSAGLGRADRARNLDGAMRAVRPRAPTPVLLVDDVVTTGATLREARRALSDAGWPVLGAAAIAATPSPRSHPDRGPVPTAEGARRNCPTGHAQRTGLASG